MFYVSEMADQCCSGTCWNSIYKTWTPTEQARKLVKPHSLELAGDFFWLYACVENKRSKEISTTAAAFTWRHFYWKVIQKECPCVCVKLVELSSCFIVVNVATRVFRLKYTLQWNESRGKLFFKFLLFVPFKIVALDSSFLWLHFLAD